MNECGGTESDSGLWASTQSRNSATSESSRASSRNAIAPTSESGHGDGLLILTSFLIVCVAEPVAITDEAASVRHGAQLLDTPTLHLAFEAKNAFIVLAKQAFFDLF